jgi:hypothetical protein
VTIRAVSTTNSHISTSTGRPNSVFMRLPSF